MNNIFQNYEIEITFVTEKSSSVIKFEQYATMLN
jgi:hypothetical protein